jgi:hypothetical protein
METETIRKARQTNLAEYLINSGVSLEKQGGRYRHKEHDSLTFHENSYFWNSRQEHGNAVDFLVRHMDMDFKRAVAELTEFVCDERAQGNIKGADLVINSDILKVREYLNKARNIGGSVIDYLSENELLYQEKRTNNAIFPMYDENNIEVGAELQGIVANKRFKGVKKGSKYGYGFNVRFSEDNTFDYALFFESAVDLISFADYKINHDEKTLKRCILVSMAGLKINILKHTLKAFKGDLKAVLCVDNDEAGREFINRVKRENIAFLECLPDGNFKDWNEHLTAWRNKKPILKLIERNNTIKNLTNPTK